MEILHFLFSTLLVLRQHFLSPVSSQNHPTVPKNDKYLCKYQYVQTFEEYLIIYGVVSQTNNHSLVRIPSIRPISTLRP